MQQQKQGEGEKGVQQPCPGTGSGGQRPINGRVELAQALFFAGCACLAYVVLGVIVRASISGDPHARKLWDTEVPLVLCQMSATAFFTACVLNLTSFLFEDSVAKRQLALLSCTIKAAACYSDLLLATGKLPILFDAHGSLFIPHRYVQWAVTTPLMVLIISKLSDFPWQRTAVAMVADTLMVMMGLCSHLLPNPWHWLPFGASMCLFGFVMCELANMVASAIKESTRTMDSANSRRSLMFIYICTLLIWSLFPIAWLTMYLRPGKVFANETLVMFANFGAKVLFSSSIMYGNYITIGQRRILARLDDENRDRIQLISDLKEAVSRKDQFMSLMSHELRTPLNGIIQLGDALCRGAGGELNSKGQHFLRTIKNSSNHLLNIINDILDVAALKEGKLTIKHEAVDLAKAAEHVCDIVSPLAKKEVTIERRIHPATPLIVGDFSRMVQVLYNLLGNSLKFTQHGIVRVSVAPADRTGMHVTVMVEDTGIGISPGKIPQIWGAFEQVDMSTTRKYGGTGLGLSIVKQLVEAHEGEIHCKSKEGKGTAFIMRLPVLPSGRNLRSSIETKIHQSLESLGYDYTAALARSGSLNGSLRASSNMGEGVGGSRSNTGDLVTSGNNSSGLQPVGTATSDYDEDESERFIKRRTKELETEALMNDLTRRTFHKCSIDDEAMLSIREHNQRSRASQQQQQQQQQQEQHQINPALLGEKLAHQQMLLQEQHHEHFHGAKRQGTSWSGPQGLGQELAKVNEAPDSESASTSNSKRSLIQLPRSQATTPLPMINRDSVEPQLGEDARPRGKSSDNREARASAVPWGVAPMQHATRSDGKLPRSENSTYGPGQEHACKEQPSCGALSTVRGSADVPRPPKGAHGFGAKARRASSSLIHQGKGMAASFFGTLFPKNASQTNLTELLEFGPPKSLINSSSDDEKEDFKKARRGVNWDTKGLATSSVPSRNSQDAPEKRRQQRRGMGGVFGGDCKDYESGQVGFPDKDGASPSQKQGGHGLRDPQGLAPQASKSRPSTERGINWGASSTSSRLSGERSNVSGPPSGGLRSVLQIPSHTSIDSVFNCRTPSLPPVPPSRATSTLAAGLNMEKLAYSNMYARAQILSVDDEEVNQIVLEEILTCAGYVYARAMDGDEAMEWLSAQDTLPDLILLDCMMPNMSGHEFCTRLRQHIPGTMLPVIMVSAKSNEDNIVEGLRSGSNDFIRKPYQREELLARIETQLRLKNDSWWLAELTNNKGNDTESMKLLKNILPESIIQRMQSGQKFVADSHQHVVILFSDIVGFTRLSSKLPTAEIFLMLSNIFNAFDKLTDRFSVYKVETIGDAYMVAAGHDEDDVKKKKGLPVERVLNMAKGMMDVVQNITAPNGERLRMRIGVHCGPAFAGVIGSKCPRYCFLGDTVNTASRMESMSFPMCIQVSTAVHKSWPEGHAQLVELGAREVKGKGLMTTYLLKYGQWQEGVRTVEREIAEAAAKKELLAKKRQQQGGGFVDEEEVAAAVHKEFKRPKSLGGAAQNCDEASMDHASLLDTPQTTRDLAALTKPWEKEDMDLVTHTSSFVGDATSSHLSHAHNFMLAQTHSGSHRGQMSRMTTRCSMNGVPPQNPSSQMQSLNPDQNSQRLVEALQSQTDALQAQLLQAGQETANARTEAHTHRTHAQQLVERLRATSQGSGPPPSGTVFYGPAYGRGNTAPLWVGEGPRRSSLDQPRHHAASTGDGQMQLSTPLARHLRPFQHTNDFLTAQLGTSPAGSTPTQQQQYMLQKQQAEPPAHRTPTQLASQASSNQPIVTSPLSNQGLNQQAPLRHHTSPAEMEHWVMPRPKPARMARRSSSMQVFGSNALLMNTSSGSNLLIPPLSLAQLFADLGLEAYSEHFEAEGVQLDMLLTMDFKQLDALGLRALGHCIRVRESVLDLAKGLLRMCEARASQSASMAKVRVVVPQDLGT